MRRRFSLIWAVAAAVMIFAPMTNVAQATTHGVVISAMYPGGGNPGATYTHDYIEIFNASSSPVDITDWSVQYSNPVSAHWQKTFLPSLVLQPGQYLLARQDPGPHGTVTPPADAQGSSGMQGDGAFKVTIVRSRLTIHGHSPWEDASMTGRIEDFFGGGVANRWEGQAKSGTLDWTQAWFRHGGGCQDTDNNNNDFYSGTAYPNMRSLTTPLAPCFATTGTTGTISSTESIDSGQAVSVTVNDADIESGSVDISAVASNGDTETLTLNGSGGSFSGMFTVANAAANSGNGSLELQSGTITFTYVDALDGDGLTNQDRTDITTVNAVVTTGTTGTIDAPDDIAPGAQYSITVADADLNGPTVDVTVTSDAGELQVVTLDLLAAGLYSGTFNTTDVDPAPNNGVIEGRDGHTLTAAYTDELDANGSENQTRTAQTTITASSLPVVDIELAVNGGFEDGGTGWKLKGIGVKVKCGAAGDGSDCGLKLTPKGKAHQRGTMGPILATVESAAGDELDVSAAVRSKKAGQQRVVMVVVNYVDPTAGATGKGKDKFKLFIEEPTSGYETFSETFVLADTITNGRIVVANTLTAGKLRVDDVSVVLRTSGIETRAVETPPRAADGVLPPPAAPESFRGSN